VTAHNTTAAASSTKTKLYGNGQTAGQIAQRYGASPSATLYGPGNSQPHKTGCGTHQVDVHALKAHGGSTCAKTPPTQGQSNENGKSNEHGNSNSGASESTEDHVTICHATGSSAHPFVVISPSASGVFHGHMGHQDVRDIVPTFTFGGQKLSLNWTAQSNQSLFAAGCGTASVPTTPGTTSSTPGTPTTSVITAQQTPQTTQQTPAAQSPASSTSNAQGTPATQNAAGTPATQNTAGTPATKNTAAPRAASTAHRRGTTATTAR